MQVSRDNQNLYDSNDLLDVAIISVLGNREEQQDCFGYVIDDGGGIYVICDGMGGHKDGKQASNTAVSTIIKLYENMEKGEVVDSLQMITREANKAVYSISNDSEGRHPGSTLIMLYIDNGKLYWNSVGDSRAYLFRKGEFVQFTVDQNYGTVLNEQLNAGMINREKYDSEQSMSEALVNYLGLPELELIDYNCRPLQLEKDDRIIMMTDGLYRLVPEKSIIGILNNFTNIGEALEALESRASHIAKKDKINRDNMTAVIISIK